jgi:hypothetical protein
MMIDNWPDEMEISELDAEETARRNRKVRADIENVPPEGWEQHWNERNADSIARGWGPLPF